MVEQINLSINTCYEENCRKSKRGRERCHSGTLRAQERTERVGKILTADNSELYEKLVRDMGETSSKFQQWWDTMAEKYHWESSQDGHWEINFETCEISLVTPV